MKKTVIGALLGLSIGAGSLAGVAQLGALPWAVEICDTVAMNDFRATERARNTPEGDRLARYLKEEIDACEGRVVQGFADHRYPLTPPPAAAAADCPQQFLANTPADKKAGANAYGPIAPLKPSLAGLDMDSLNADQAAEEHTFVRHCDPMQTSVGGNSLGFIPGGEVDKMTKLYAGDRQAWMAMNKRVDDRFGEMTRTVRRIPAGTPVQMQYALPGEIPMVVWDDHVVFPYDIFELVYTDKDGKEYRFRLKCKFQGIGSFDIPKMPTPSQGLKRNPEGTPEVEKPPSSTTTPPVTTTHETTSTPPVTTTTNTSECPNGQKPPCAKTPATGASGVGTATDNPVGTPTTATSQTKPLDPNPPTQPPRTTAPPAGGSTPASATATISAPPPRG